MNEWHFSRPVLAEHYLKLLDLGISSSLAIIAPRRRGKTLFILNDITSLAQKKNYIPVYASLWQNTNSPHEGLILALEETIQSLDKRAVLRRLLDSKIKKTTVSNELLGKMEVEFAENPIKPSNKELAYLDKLLTELDVKSKKKTVLLLIDEVQHLATSKQFDTLTHALRTMLDKRQGKIKTIFTGSSRHYMNLLFNESQSPFYHFVETVPFPELSDDFIQFLKNKLAQDHNTKVTERDLSRAFNTLDHSPYWMMKVISNLVTYKMRLADALDHVLLLLEASEGFETIAKNLKPIDHIVFLALCKENNPFSMEIFEKIEKETSVKGISSNVQRSIQRLSEKHLITQIQRGTYYIEKPGLQHYLNRYSEE